MKLHQPRKPAFPETAELSGPATLVRTSPAAVRSLKASRASAQTRAARLPPPCFEPTPRVLAILRVLPSSRGLPMDTVDVVLALKGADPPVELRVAGALEELTALAALGLVLDFPAKESWTRSPAGDDVVASHAPDAPNEDDLDERDCL